MAVITGVSPPRIPNTISSSTRFSRLSGNCDVIHCICAWIVALISSIGMILARVFSSAIFILALLLTINLVFQPQFTTFEQSFLAPF